MNNSGAAAINACPTGPLRCLWRPSSLLKVSNTPNVLGESLSAYQLICGLLLDQLDLFEKPSGASKRTLHVASTTCSQIFFPSGDELSNDLGTVRGRIGLAVDRTLLYFTAGLAFAEVANNVQYNSSKFPTFNTLVLQR